MTEETPEDRIAALERQILVLAVALVALFTVSTGVGGVAVRLALRPEAPPEPDFLAAAPPSPAEPEPPTPTPEPNDADPGALPDVIEAREFRVVGRPGGPPIVRIGQEPYTGPEAAGFIRIRPV